MRVLITGAGGYRGSKLLTRWASRDDLGVVALDVRPTPPADRRDGVEYHTLDIRDPALVQVLRENPVDAVVHLAAVVTPSRGMGREEQYSIDVEGTRNLLEASVQSGVRRLVVTSSGAAYGYHPDNPRWLREDDPLRGNEEFAYAHHKRLTEEILAQARREHPEMEQVVLRLSTVLGVGVSNDITRFFAGPFLLGVLGGDSRFVFVWDEDVARCLEHALTSTGTGVFNLAGDGALPVDELARRMGKRCVWLPAALLRTVLAIARPLGLSRYGPEQVRFVQYRPVLHNGKLKEAFGEVLTKTSSETFDFFLASLKASGRTQSAHGDQGSHPQ